MRRFKLLRGLIPNSDERATLERKNTSGTITRFSSRGRLLRLKLLRSVNAQSKMRGMSAMYVRESFSGMRNAMSTHPARRIASRE
jgi:hypothetical protein